MNIEFLFNAQYQEEKERERSKYFGVFIDINQWLLTIEVEVISVHLHSLFVYSIVD